MPTSAPASTATRLVRAAQQQAARTSRPVLATWAEPGPDLDIVDAFARALRSVPIGERHLSLWLQPSPGDAYLGIGAAHTLTARGDERFATIGGAWRNLVAEAVCSGAEHDGGPRLLGGFRFDVQGVRSRIWTGFEDAVLTVPERMISVHGERAWVRTALLAGSTDVDGRQPLSMTATCPDDDRDDGQGLSESAWCDLVGDTAQAIRAGSAGVRKVVLARAETVRAGLSTDEEIDLVASVRRLAALYPTCTIFAFVRGDACFLGATPERLVGVHAGVASTMALAGSAPRGASAAEDADLVRRLLADPKERHEHALVVEAIRADLEASGAVTRVVTDAEPRVHRLPNVQHLLTRVQTGLREGASVLDLVARLHPTPAVGGTPRPAALALIRERERLDRGWYAGPVGFVDAAGQGEFAVAIRSALVRGQTATLFGGCGVVDASQPRAELAESTWKMRAMREALGLT